MSAWARHDSELLKKKENLRHEFKKQNLIYTGGGQWYGNDVARLYRNPDQFNIGRKDDETIWTLIAYLAGYDNYVYHGSVALHRTLIKGGNRAHQATQPNSQYVGFPEFINYEYCQDGAMAIPLDKNINAKARQLHKENREKIFGIPKIIIPPHN
jgi:hypothetical protein